jgi:hypothetical protein
MKFCPTCETRYDEDILKFCMKDGSPLVDEAEPNFVDMPSENLDVPDEDDLGEVTILRKKTVVPKASPIIDDITFEDDEEPPPRIVVPMSAQPQQPRARVAVQPEAPPRTNTLLVVFLTMIGTVALLAIGAGGLWLIMRSSAPEANVNANIANLLNSNIEANSNLGNMGDFNFNGLPNFGTNTNSNANTDLRSPSPTPTPTPKPSPSPSPTSTPDRDDETPMPTPLRTPIASPTPLIIRPGASPTPRDTGTPANNASDGGI